MLARGERKLHARAENLEKVEAVDTGDDVQISVNRGKVSIDEEFDWNS